MLHLTRCVYVLATSTCNCRSSATGSKAFCILSNFRYSSPKYARYISLQDMPERERERERKIAESNTIVHWVMERKGIRGDRKYESIYYHVSAGTERAIKIVHENNLKNN